MKKSIVHRFGMGLVMLTSMALAAIDTSDIDDDVMRGMDDAIKDLEPMLGASNADGALTDAQVVREGLKWTEEYFVSKGGADDAVAITRDGLALVDIVLKATADRDFATAVDAARRTAKNCSRCHDVYKP